MKIQINLSILPILGSFHIEMGFMSAIYKRLKKSNIELVFRGWSSCSSLTWRHNNREKRLYFIRYFMKLCFVLS